MDWGKQTSSIILPLTGLKKLKKESWGTSLVMVLTVPLPLCFCFFLIVFTVTSLPFCQSILHLDKKQERLMSHGQLTIKSRRTSLLLCIFQPVCFSPLAVHYLWALEWKRVCWIWLGFHFVRFSEDCIAEVAIGLEMELQSETLVDKKNTVGSKIASKVYNWNYGKKKKKSSRAAFSTDHWLAWCREFHCDVL